MISENDSALRRGRIPAHEMKEVMNVSLMLLRAKANLLRHNIMMLNIGLDVLSFNTQQSSLPISARAYQDMISRHYMSYDSFSRPYKFYDLPKVRNPAEQFSSHGFYELTGFWPEQVSEISRELIFIPPIIRCRSTGCIAPKELAIFLLLRRWHIPGKWDGVSRDLRQQRGWCIQIYDELFKLLVVAYRKCVRVLDYRRINPKLEEWGRQMSLHCGCDENVIFFTDGKPWKMTRPGRGTAVQQICQAAGCGDVNLMQRAFYNGHYKYHGAKVQHVVQADGIAYSFTCPIQNHDALVLRNSHMILMLSSVFISSDINRPAVTVTDKAYGRTDHFKPIHTDAELRMMAPIERAAAVEFDKKHKKPRMAVEYSFNQQVTKFRHIDDYRRHRMTQNGRVHWQRLRCLWDMQTFFFNLYTCSAGSQVTGTLGVSPPTVSEYLYSVHHNLLVDFPMDENDEQFDGDAADAYYI